MHAWTAACLLPLAGRMWSLARTQGRASIHRGSWNRLTAHDFGREGGRRRRGHEEVSTGRGAGGGRRPIAATADRTHPAHPSRGERLSRPRDRGRSAPDGRRVWEAEAESAREAHTRQDRRHVYLWILPFRRAEDQFSAPVAHEVVCVPVKYNSMCSDVSCDFPRARRAILVVSSRP